MAEAKKSTGLWYDFVLQPITDIHLKSNLAAEIGVNGNLTYVYTFTIIAILVLLIACANYINLSTAKSMTRFKEIGMRKVIGANRKQLMVQLLEESLLLIIIALIIAITLVAAVLPKFNELTSKVLSLNIINNPSFISITFLVFILVAFLAGGYPAVVLSSFSPANTLKRSIKGKSGQWFRKSLVVFQFSVSIILIAATILIFQKMDFIQNKTLGLNKEQVLLIKLSAANRTKYEQIKSEMQKLPDVVSASNTSFTYSEGVNTIQVLPEGFAENQTTSEASISADFDFLKTFKIELSAGRDFSRDFSTDLAEAFIVNEKAVKTFNWGTPEQAIGKKLDWGLGKKGAVVGVVKDFNFNSLHESVEPLVIHMLPRWYEFLAIKLKSKNLPQTLDNLKENWRKLNLDGEFSYSFLDQDFEKLYKAEHQAQTIVGLFSFLAIFIACLGLLGLASFTAQLRTKEIGVRKVLGADIASVIALLSFDFLKPVVLAICLAVPITCVGMNKWLSNFAYKIEISWWVFVVAGALAILIALLTISSQSIKAALSNPVKSLRSE